MKKIGYSFYFPGQIASALVAFILNVGIPYMTGDSINWFTTILVTVSVFFSAGLRYFPKK